MTTARRRTTLAVRTISNLATREATGTEWQTQGACRLVDAETFFPIGTGPASEREEEEAKATCRRCPVMLQCRAWALDTGQKYGVWGGLSERELLSERRRRGRAVSAVDTVLVDRLVAERGGEMLAWLLEEKVPLGIIGRRLGHRTGDGQLVGVPSVGVLRLAFRRLGAPMDAMVQKPAVARAVEQWDTVEKLRAKDMSWRSISVRVGVGEEALREACTLIEEGDAPGGALKLSPSVKLVMDEWPRVQELRQGGVGQMRIAREFGVGVGTLREAIRVMEQRQSDETSDRTAVAS